MDRVIAAYGQQEGLDYTLFRPFNWIGAGLDSIHTAKEGSSRVITQFFGHIVRGEPISLVDGGAQKRAFTYIDDGIAALMKIIANDGGVASGKIYNIGNPANNFSVRELATMMLDARREVPRVRRHREEGAAHRDDVGRVLRRRLPGRAEPRPEDRQHDGRPRLEAAGRDGRRAGAHLRRVSRPGRRGARARRLSAAGRGDAFTIRRAERADLPALHRLVLGLARYERLEDQVVSTPGHFERALFDDGAAVEAVMLWPGDRDDGEPVGFALFFHNFSTFLGRRGLYLEDLFVEPAHRGRGFGRALLKHLAALAVERGCGRFEWAVLDWNVDAQAFYRSLGAVVMPDWRITRVTGEALSALAR